MHMKLHLRGEGSLGPLSLATRHHIYKPSFRSTGRQRPHILTLSAFKETEGSVETIDNDDAFGAFAKFQPFSAESDLRRRMVGYRREFPVKGGSTLVIQPLTEDWIDSTADLLTGTFAESMGYVSVYKRFLGNQIRKYLHHHMALPPKAIVLLAFLVPAAAAVEEAAVVAVASSTEQETELNLLEPVDQSTSNSLNNAAVSSEEEVPLVEGSTGASGSRAEREEVDSHAVLGDGMGAVSSLSGIEDDIQTESGIAEKNSLVEAAPTAAENEEDADTSLDQLFKKTINKKSSSNSLDGGGGRETVKKDDRLKGAILVGSLELSFSQSTRSKDFTLNAPPERPYMCNLAVTDEWRGRGFASLLLTASEELVADVGEECIYLHLRFQDIAAARLYSKAGYGTVAQDSFLVKLLGLDRRYLMKKKLRGDLLK